MSEPIRERCPKCCGVGLLMDKSTDALLTGPPEPEFRPCLRCMEHGFVASRTLVWAECQICEGFGEVSDPATDHLDAIDQRIELCAQCGGLGQYARRRSVLELLAVFPHPDPENPRFYPTPEQGRCEDMKRKELRERRGYRWVNN